MAHLEAEHRLAAQFAAASEELLTHPRHAHALDLDSAGYHLDTPRFRQDHPQLHGFFKRLLSLSSDRRSLNPASTGLPLVPRLPRLSPSCRSRLLLASCPHPIPTPL